MEVSVLANEQAVRAEQEPFLRTAVSRSERENHFSLGTDRERAWESTQKPRNLTLVEGERQLFSQLIEMPAREPEDSTRRAVAWA